MSQFISITLKPQECGSYPYLHHTVPSGNSPSLFSLCKSRRIVSMHKRSLIEQMLEEATSSYLLWYLMDSELAMTE